MSRGGEGEAAKRKTERGRSSITSWETTKRTASLNSWR